MIISMVNQKGGVGKSTLAICLAYESVLQGNRVLLVDADPQASIMRWTDNRKESYPLSHRLSAIALPKKTLHRDLPSMEHDYDIIIIDSAPRLSDITISVIAASDFILVPCTPSPYDIWASEDTINYIITLESHNPNRKYAMAINSKRNGTAIARDMNDTIAELSKKLGEKIPVMKSEISKLTVFVNTAMFGLAVQEDDKELKASGEIAQLYKEIIECMSIQK